MSREKDIHEFVKASNLIEGIKREPYPQETEMVEAFLALPEITIADVASAVSVFEPGALLRNQYGMNVRVGCHIPPSGSPRVAELLGDIVAMANDLEDIHMVHCEFQLLHPFTDGNGRSGRLIWLWMMMKRNGGFFPERGFLHEFYYQALAAHRG